MSAVPTPPEDGGDFVIGPDFPPAADLAFRPEVPRGSVHAFCMDSRDSRLFPGVRRLDNDITRRRDRSGNRLAAEGFEQSTADPYLRTVWVYVPGRIDRGRPAPLLIVQDGHHFLNRLPRVLDNLIAGERLPGLVAVLVDSGGGDAQGSQRGLEYDTVSTRYSAFIETEVLPEVVRRTGVALTDDPEQRGTLGVSSGGACAFTMAWLQPDLYRKVVSYSGTFVNQQSPMDPLLPRGAWEHHATLIPGSRTKPIRIWLEVGEKDLHADDPEETWHNWPLANRRMAQALRAKNYDYRFCFSLGGRHADPRVLDHTLPAALEWTWRGFGS